MISACDSRPLCHSAPAVHLETLLQFRPFAGTRQAEWQKIGALGRHRICFLEAFAIEALRRFSRQTVKEYGTQPVLVCSQSDEHERDRVPSVRL